MTTVLATNAYKAARSVYSSTSRLPKHLRTLPVLACMALYHHEGRMAVTQMIFDDKKQELVPITEYIPARTDDSSTWATCVPAKPFTDWLHASLPTKQEKAHHVSEQIELTFDPTREVLHIQAGKTRAEFKCLPAAEFPPC